MLALLTRPAPPAWSTRKGRGGPRKTHDSAGRYCTNPRCEYFAISDSAIHALVADGQHHGVPMWQCQARHTPVCDTFGTFLYGKQKAPETMWAVLSDLCHAHGIRQTAHDLGVNKNTVVAWLTKCGECAPLLRQLLAEGKLHVATSPLDH